MRHTRRPGNLGTDRYPARVPDLPTPIVSPEWLNDHLGEPTLIVADVRWVPGGSARESFEATHIPGARSFDLDADLSAPAGQGPGRHPLPSSEAFAATMSKAGIGGGDPVVCYDDVAGSVAARLWWMLDAIGHRAAVLDGGLQAWVGPVEQGPGPPCEPAAFTARPWPHDRIVDADRVAEAIRNHHALVLDARAAERYMGETEPIDPVAGHIPGALSAPWASNLDPATGRFLPARELRARYEALGSTEAAICSCGSGTTACHDILAIEIAGLGRARLYEGSWSDWCRDPARPVATGPGPGKLS